MSPDRLHRELEHTARLIEHEEAKERAARAARDARDRARARNARRHDRIRQYEGWGRDRPAPAA